ncbi:MAG: hypothetical protein ACYTGV_18010, partial [Planctomycetota bacterium]
MTDRNDIEKLVASAYRDIRPSAAVKEEVQRSLPTARARRRALGPVALSLILLTSAAFVAVFALDRLGQFDTNAGFAGEGGDAGLQLPLVARPPSGVVTQKTDWIRIRLAGDGRILLPPSRPEEAWRESSLDDLGMHLARETEAFAERERKEQRSGYEVLATGAKASRLRVVLQVDRDAPWVHVQWLLAICAEQRAPKIAFAVRSSDDREFWLDATLPTDRGVGPPREEIRVSVRAVVRLRSEEDWRRKRADMPTVVRYRFGDQEVEELATVARWLEQARTAAEGAEATLRGEIRAARKLPYHHVAKLLAEFRASGYAQVDFFGTQIPNAAIRAARELPHPLSSWPDERVDRSTDPRKEKPLLVFEVEEGDPTHLERALEVVRRRLRVAGFGELKASIRGDLLLIEMPEEKARIEEIQALVERSSAQLEFHITLEPSAATYDLYWQRLKRALAEGAGFERVRDVLPEERAKSDIASGRYPLGLRWYGLSKRASEVGLYSATRLPEGEQPYVLCINDPCRITERSLRNVAHRRSFEALGGHWIVVFEVEEGDPTHLERALEVVRRRLRVAG